MAFLTKILVWDLPTRVFHWLLAIAFMIAFVTREMHEIRMIHKTAGVVFLLLIIFRIVWGFCGSQHARFSSFIKGPQALYQYLRSLWMRQPIHYTGHNPAGGIAILLLLFNGIGLTVTGMLHSNGFKMFLVHKTFAILMVLLIIIHIVAVLVSSFLHHEDLVGAMFSGYKQGKPTEAVIHTKTHKNISGMLLMGVAVIIAILYINF